MVVSGVGRIVCLTLVGICMSGCVRRMNSSVIVRPVESSVMATAMCCSEGVVDRSCTSFIFMLQQQEMFKVVEALLRKKKSCPRVRLTRSGVLGVYSEIGLMSRQI